MSEVQHINTGSLFAQNIVEGQNLGRDRYDRRANPVPIIVAKLREGVRTEQDQP